LGLVGSEVCVGDRLTVELEEVEVLLRELDVDNLVDLRRRTRLGMGPCQGAVSYTHLRAHETCYII
ncbi:hypothetical protein ACETWN_22405, partial [Aeromonas hydrophila]|uniref:hypothetical protein n=1 Tax=Aeromonas hydrophila TaxID=644 RepID=UPI0035A34E7C